MKFKCNYVLQQFETACGIYVWKRLSSLVPYWDWSLRASKLKIKEGYPWIFFCTGNCLATISMLVAVGYKN